MIFLGFWYIVGLISGALFLDYFDVDLDGESAIAWGAISACGPITWGIFFIVEHRSRNRYNQTIKGGD